MTTSRHPPPWPRRLHRPGEVRGAFRTWRGRPFSGGSPPPLCIAGGICKQILARKGIYVGAHIAAVGVSPTRAMTP